MLAFEEKHNSFHLQRAIILAAGFGMRMVPIGNIVPKALLKIKGESLIDRMIRFLHEKDITEIYIVVGFKKEEFEYLIDKYNVKLVDNPLFFSKNNLHSLYLVREHLENSYIIPADLWSSYNPFSFKEGKSWYMVSDFIDNESSMQVIGENKLIVSKDGRGNKMIGISYLSSDIASVVKKKLEDFDSKSEYDNCYWEETLLENDDQYLVSAKIIRSSEIVEINTYEQLRNLDCTSENLKSDVMQTINEVLGVTFFEIKNIIALKKGMTNRSFLFCCYEKKYIMRVPGEGTDRLINRAEEAEVYHVIGDSELCDEVKYINPQNGYKLSVFLENARNCDAYNPKDVKRCMARLREFHNMKLTVGHCFDLFERIDFYESLWNGASSTYSDYEQTKHNVFSLRSYIELHKKEFFLTHIDAVSDNFLFVTEDGKEQIRLIDWEYAGMQDQDVDLAMFCIYSLYDRLHVDALIDSYYLEGCPKDTRRKIYCYVAICGLLWSNWCEYKRNLGVDFGEYASRQYDYAKEYFQAFQESFREIKK